ncbi:MAG: MFS transporter [Planctomycetota bacterium]|nr:MAG: MFS transporter [Planctomycetota bacterium]
MSGRAWARVPGAAPGGHAGTASWARAWAFVPTAYFVQGLPYNAVTQTMQLSLQDYGIDKALINTALGAVLLVWSLKMAWAPLVDGVLTKRTWTVATQLLGGAVLGALGLLADRPPEAFLAVAVGAMAVAALLSATHDIALDGYYMLALDPRQQAFFVGVRAAAWRLALVFATGALVWLVGLAQEQPPAAGTVPAAWRQVLRAVLGLPGPGAGVVASWRWGWMACAALMIGLGLYHALVLPRPAADRPAARGGPMAAFGPAFRSYLRQPGLVRLLAFILLYRFAEVLLAAMAKLFLRDPPAAGGMGLDLQQVGLVYGTVGVVGLVLGGVLGGAAVARWGIARTLWPLALAMNAPDVVYLYLAWRPETPLGVVAALVGLEQLGYGMGFSAFLVVLLRAARPPYQTTHYAISTGIMGLGLMVPTALSGWLQAGLGYSGYFALVCALAIPCLLTVEPVRRMRWQE